MMMDDTGVDQARRWPWRISKEQAEATGREVDDGFVVRKGSTAMRDGSPKVKRDRSLRDRLVAEGVLVPDENPALLRFSQDHRFSARSPAAGVVIDGNSNGDHWKEVSEAPSSSAEGKALSRAEVEAAMDAFEEYYSAGTHRDFFDAFSEPRQFWVRSTRERENRIFPSKPIVGFVRSTTDVNGGWSQRHSAAAILHISGFVIVDEKDVPIAPPETAVRLINDANRIRLVALNYFIAPAREAGSATTVITVKEIARLTCIKNAPANICQALEGDLFQQLAHVPPPVSTQPNPSSSTEFTYTFAGTKTVTDTTDVRRTAATNLILYGPPGTGKTYHSVWEAVRLCLGDTAAQTFAGQERREELMEEYRRLVAEGRIEFVTFHQSTSYEEFVEGLRPSTDTAGDEEGNAKSGFSLAVHDGIFKQISDRARLDHGDEDQTPRLDRAQRVFKIALGRRLKEEDRIRFGLDEGILHIGWGGDIDWSDERFDEYDEILAEWRTIKNPEATGNDGNVIVTFSFRSDMQIGDYVVLSDGRDRIRAVGRVGGDYYFDQDATFHPHRREVDWLWKDDLGVERERFYPKAFRRHSVYKLDQSSVDWDALEELTFGATLATAASARDHVLIIDEINRANISKVFGELITLLEFDKRLGLTNEIRLTLPYSKKSFGVPANLHIIGTMNTADRSIALLDTALRRRFAFRELMPDPEALSDNVDGINLRRLLETINDHIEYLFDREHQIGHAYFTACTNREEIQAAIRHKVIPLLTEYFYEDWSRVAMVLGDFGRQEPRFLVRETLLPPPGLRIDGGEESRTRWRVRSEEFDLSEFLA